MRYLSYCFTDFDKICCHDAYYPLELQFLVSAFTEGWHIGKFPFCFYSWPQNSEYSANNRFQAKLVKHWNIYDIFADVWPILMKFCMTTHISYLQHNSCSQGQFKKKSRWWTLPLKKLSNAISQLLFHWFW